MRQATVFSVIWSFFVDSEPLINLKLAKETSSADKIVILT